MRRGTQSYSAVYTNGAEPGSPQWDTIALGRHHTIGQAARTAQMTIPPEEVRMVCCEELADPIAAFLNGNEELTRRVTAPQPAPRRMR